MAKGNIIKRRIKGNRMITLRDTGKKGFGKFRIISNQPAPKRRRKKK